MRHVHLVLLDSSTVRTRIPFKRVDIFASKSLPITYEVRVKVMFLLVCVILHPPPRPPPRKTRQEGPLKRPVRKEPPFCPNNVIKYKVEHPLIPCSFLWTLQLVLSMTRCTAWLIWCNRPRMKYDGRLCFHRCVSVHRGVPLVSGLKSFLRGTPKSCH